MFHICIVLAFLLADVNMKGNVKEEEVLIEFPDLPLEPEIPDDLFECAECGASADVEE